jgi:hypothetical protein
MIKIPIYIPVPNFIALIVLWPILLYRWWKYGFSFMRIKLTRGKFAIVDGYDFLKLYRFNWYAKESCGTFYAKRSQRLNGRKKEILMHRQIMQPERGFCIDHRNHIGLDNRRENLRQATHAQNNYNRKKIPGTGSSIYKGVMFHKDHNKFYAGIKINRQKIFLGYFDNEIDAARAYDKAAKLYHKDFASLNFPAPANGKVYPVRCLLGYLIGASLNFDSAPEIPDKYKKIIFGG